MTARPSDSYEPIPAHGAGAESFDMPALFYLTHQPVIDEWYGLRRTVSEAVNNWLETTARAELAALAAGRGTLLSRVPGPEKHTHLVVHPDAMPLLNGRPILGIGVGWPAASVNPMSNAPFACVRRSGSDAGKLAAAALMRAGGRDFRSREMLKGRDEDVWPVYSYVPARSDWWTDLDGYLRSIIGLVERYIDGLSGPLASVLAEVEKLPTDTGEEADDPDTPDLPT